MLWGEAAGLVHSLSHHGEDGWRAVVLPPYAWFRGIEALFHRSSEDEVRLPDMVSLSFHPRQPALTPRDIALRGFASVVVIETDDPGKRSLAIGSGFVVQPGVIATNLHVVRGATSGSVKLVGDSDKVKISGVLAVDRARDLVLLSVPGIEAPTLPVRSVEDVAIGDPIYVLGNPQGLEGTFSEGIVSGKRRREATRLVQITAPISSGSSGSPVLDDHGRVIGIVNASTSSGQNLNFAVAADHLSSLLGRTGEVRQLAEVTQPAAAGKLEPKRVAAVPEPPATWMLSWLDRVTRTIGLR
jgi:S1-C subfamily serine protease